jgi:predicted RNA-binding protein with PIN domain
VQKFIIDGNNLIGKIRELQRLQKKDKQAAREKLVLIIERYFSRKKVKISLHFDGFQNTPISISSAKIHYSDNKTADEKIKDEISASKNPRNLTLITSDNNLKEFARVCSVSVISSDEFSAEMKKDKDENEEEMRIKSMNNVEEFKKIFNVKK